MELCAVMWDFCGSLTVHSVVWEIQCGGFRELPVGEALGRHKTGVKTLELR